MPPGTSLAALLWLSAAASAIPSSAPLGVRTQGTLRELFLDMPLADARTGGALEMELRWSMANDWSAPTLLERGGRQVQLRTDEQADALGISLRLPWGRLLAGAGPWAAHLWTAVETRLTLHWGGWSDRPIDAWHGVAFTSFGRGGFPRDAVGLFLGEPGRAARADLHSACLALGDVVVRTQLLLAEGGEPSGGRGARRGLAARLDLKLPTGRLDRLGGSGGFDAGVGLLGTAELLPWLTGHALMALSVWSGLPDLPLQPRRWHGTFEISLAVTAGQWVFLLEDRLLTPAFEPGWHFVEPQGSDGLQASAAFATLRPHNQVTVGVRHGAFTFWLSEDFTPGPNFSGGAGWFYDSNAPDVTLGLACRLPL
jgi:hypothetical protein